MTVQFIDGANIEALYDNATHMTVVGLACKGFLEDLNYDRVRIGDFCDQRGEGERLAALRRSKLFPHLRRGLLMHVSLLNPHCDYSNERAREEASVNPNCRVDLHASIEAFRVLSNDLNSVASDQSFKIEGSLEVHALASNPYFSYTHVVADGQADIVRVGFLLLQKRGVDCPAILVDDNEPLSLRAKASFLEHEARLPNDRVFSWDASGAQFHGEDYTQRGAYNVFFCYNHHDLDVVSNIAQRLYLRGLVPWMDQRLPGGSDWDASIRRAVNRSPCAAVFFGPSGVGYWQMRELQLIHERTNDQVVVIPVVLPKDEEGIEPSPVPETPFRMFQEIYVSRDGEEALTRLAAAIRRANGF